MLKSPVAYQHEIEMVTLEALVSADHLVRKIDAAIHSPSFLANGMRSWRACASR